MPTKSMLRKAEKDLDNSFFIAMSEDEIDVDLIEKELGLEEGKFEEMSNQTIQTDGDEF